MDCTFACIRSNGHLLVWFTYFYTHHPISICQHRIRYLFCHIVTNILVMLELLNLSCRILYTQTKRQRRRRRPSEYKSIPQSHLYTSKIHIHKNIRLHVGTRICETPRFDYYTYMNVSNDLNLWRFRVVIAVERGELLMNCNMYLIIG